MRIRLSLLAFLCLVGYTGFGQQARVKKYTAPKAGTVVLKDVDDKYNTQVTNLEAPEVEDEHDMQQLREIKKKVSEQYPRKSSNMGQKKTTSVPEPIVSISFVADSFSGIPPDNYSAVSNDNKGVAVMNSNITVHDALSGAYITRKGLLPFSAIVGLNNTIINNYNYRYDPKVVYDPGADRFISVMLNGTNEHNWIVLGFSQTNDPSGTWNFYKFYGDYTGDTTWFDYPSVAITNNEFFLTGNKIKYNTSWQAGFTQTLIYQFRKADGYNGDTAITYQIWDNIQFGGKNLRCLYPLNPGETLGGPEQYFLSNRNFDVTNDSVFLVKVPDTIGSGSTALTVTPLVSGLSYGVPPDGRQPDTSVVLATNDGRVLGGFIRGDEAQFVSESVNPANGASAIYHGIISNISTTPTVTGKIYSVDTLDFGYPNISYAGNTGGGNQSIISFEFSGPNRNPGYGAIFFDGTDYSDMVTIQEGGGSISYAIGREQRWGDYSGSQPFWPAIGLVWVEGIYGRSDHRYGDYMARLATPTFDFSGTKGVSSPAKTQGKIYPVPGWEFVSYEFSVEQEQVFSFVIYDTRGRVVDKISDSYCRDGKNVIRFNIASLAPGTYFLKATGMKGEHIDVHTFVRK